MSSQTGPDGKCTECGRKHWSEKQINLCAKSKNKKKTKTVPALTIDDGSINASNAEQHIKELDTIAHNLPSWRDFNIYEYNTRELEKITNQVIPWSVKEAENLKTVLEMKELFNETTDDNFEETIELLEESKKKLHKWNGKPWSSTDHRYGLDDRLKPLNSIAENMVWELEESANHEPVITDIVSNPGLIGLTDSRDKVFNDLNSTLYDESAFLYYNDPSMIDEAVQKQIAYGDFEKVSDKNPGFREDDEGSTYVLREDNILRNHISDTQNAYLAGVFPEKELNQRMKEVGVSNVTVSPLINGREVGNVYTVMQPDGNIRSFAVYEHRNSDSIIINGKTNWNPNEGIPYAGKSHDYFAEIGHKNYKTAADTLAFFLKEAQSGSLQSDEYLANNAPKLDWNAILEKQLPGFKEFREKHYPSVKDFEDQNTDEAILRNLNFEPES